MNLYGSICLTDIPKELIKTGKNGKKYISVQIYERREPSPYGQTHYIKVPVPKEGQGVRSAYYIGELKISNYGSDANSGQGGAIQTYQAPATPQVATIFPERTQRPAPQAQGPALFNGAEEQGVTPDDLPF